MQKVLIFEGKWFEDMNMKIRYIAMARDHHASGLLIKPGAKEVIKEAQVGSSCLRTVPQQLQSTLDCYEFPPQ